MTNRDDFLLDRADIDWLSDTLGPRFRASEHGGHLGSLYMPDVQRRLIDTLHLTLAGRTQTADPPPTLRWRSRRPTTRPLVATPKGIRWPHRSA